MRMPGESGLHRNGIPFGARLDRRHGLESLRLLPRPRNALHLGADGNLDGTCRQRRAARDLLKGEGEEGRCRHAGRQLIADEAGKLEDGAPLRRRAEVVLVGDALLIEGEHVQRRRQRVAERDGEIAVVAGAEPGERGQLGAGEPGQQRLLELPMHPDAVGNGGLAGRIVDAGRRLDVQAGAAAAVGIAHHLPPKRLKRSTPCSGKLESLSRRGISSRDSFMNPSARKLVSSMPWRWNLSACTEPTPATWRAAA